MEDEYLTVAAKRCLTNEGTVLIFEGIEVATGDEVRFVVDHRVAEPIWWSLTAGEEPECAVPTWAVVRRVVAETTASRWPGGTTRPSA
jgi:hypothetical protein